MVQTIKCSLLTNNKHKLTGWFVGGVHSIDYMMITCLGTHYDDLSSSIATIPKILSKFNSVTKTSNVNMQYCYYRHVFFKTT